VEATDVLIRARAGRRIAFASVPFRPPGRQPRRVNQLVNRVVQKALFQNLNFIGFFAPISEIGAGLLPTVFAPGNVKAPEFPKGITAWRLRP
jgi:hypothetical protein